MDLSWEQYHRFHVLILSTVGLWPHSHTFVLALQRIVGSLFTAVSLWANLGSFAKVRYDRSLLLETSSYMFVGYGMVFKYVSFLAASDSIKTVTETIDGDWKNLSSREEVRIIEKHVETGKFHTKSFAMFICPSTTVLALAPLSSFVLDMLMPLDEFRNRSLPIMFELFFDQQKHFFIAAFLFEGVIIVGALVFISTETLLIVYIQHACALFEVTSYRIKKFLCAAETKNSKSSSNFVMMEQVVDIHSRAISDPLEVRIKESVIREKSYSCDFQILNMKWTNSILWKVERYVGELNVLEIQCQTIKEKFLQSYLFLFIIGILGLSTLLFRMRTSETDNFTEFLATGMSSLAVLSYLFYINIMLQAILDSSAEIFDTLYDTKWYKFPINTQKFVLFCMFKTVKPVSMDICSIFQPSREGFSVILKMVLSYVTALHSIK